MEIKSKKCCNDSMIRTVLLGFHRKLGLYKYSLGYGKFEFLKYLALLARQAQNEMSENDLLICINQLEEFRRRL